MKLKQYTKYKESGIQWIGKIPEKWETNKIKHNILALEKSSLEASEGNEEGDYPFFTSSQIQDKFIDNFTFDKECLIMGTGGFASLHYINGKFAVSTDCLVLKKQKQFNMKFLYYQILSNISVIDDLGFWGMGLKHLQKDFFYNMLSYFPSEKEQSLIASFLDKKTSELNTLIEKDKKLIELLKEKRIALINHVVTKGLNRKAKMKDSGIDWIGKIPEGWEVRKFKHFAIKLTQGPNPDLERTVDISNFKVLKTKDLYDYDIKYEEANCLTKEAFFECIDAKLKDNDVLITIVGHGSIGKINIFHKQKQEFIFTRAIALFRPEIKKIYPKYIKFYFESKLGKECLYNLIEGSTGQEVIKTTRLGDLKIILPKKVTEQSSIASFLDKATSKMDITIQKIEKKIELLEEYKKSLIHHVVTGKVDVRGEK